MSSKINNHQIFNKLLEYESIFKHYGVETPSTYSYSENDNFIGDNENQFDGIGNILERNENNKKKISKKSGKQLKGQKTNLKSSKPASSVPLISLHAPSSSTMKTKQTLKSVGSKNGRSLSNIQSTSSLVPPTFSTSHTSTGEHTPITSSSVHGKDSTVVTKPLNKSESSWDLDAINEFTKQMFKYSNGDHDKSHIRPDHIRLNCATDQDQNLENYIQSRVHCLDIFEEYVTSLKRQHGIIRNAASDPPIFDPGVSITGPQIKKDTAIIDKEDSRTIKQMMDLEPRKKYALVHEQIGIFIIGGYNLYVDVPIQKEPDTDYLFKFNGKVVKIPPLTPCRIHFAIYTDGDAIYIAGGQTIQNELLDDIQRFDFKTLKWEYIATLTNPIAACGMTLDNKRIYLVGGYDIVQNVTTFLPDYTIYNIATGQFEKSTDLPSPRCRSLVFATNQAIFCISGLVEGRNEHHNKKTIISTDILKWTPKVPLWIKVSQTPELTKFHALSFNDPYLEITKRILNENGYETDNVAQAYYNFQTNQWANGTAPSSPKPSSTAKARTTKSPTKSRVRSPTKSKTKSPIKSKVKSPNKSKTKSPTKSRVGSPAKLKMKSPTKSKTKIKK